MTNLPPLSRRFLLAAAALALAPTMASAQSWPTAKPIRIVVAYPAGGVSDNVARALADIRSKLEATDNVPTGGTAAEFAHQIAQESENNARIIRAAGIQASN